MVCNFLYEERNPLHSAQFYVGILRVKPLFNGAHSYWSMYRVSVSVFVGLLILADITEPAVAQRSNGAGNRSFPNHSMARAVLLTLNSQPHIVSICSWFRDVRCIFQYKFVSGLACPHYYLLFLNLLCCTCSRWVGKLVKCWAARWQTQCNNLYSELKNGELYMDFTFLLHLHK